MESLVTALVPAVTAALVYGITVGVKKLQSVRNLTSKRKLLRPLAAILSFLGVVALSLATGTEVDQGTIAEVANALVSAVVAYLGATGIHELRKVE